MTAKEGERMSRPSCVERCVGCGIRVLTDIGTGLCIGTVWLGAPVDTARLARIMATARCIVASFRGPLAATLLAETPDKQRVPFGAVETNYINRSLALG